MSLFDDEFYSPKVSSWRRRRIAAVADNDRWPKRRRRRPERWMIVTALSASLGIVLLLLLLGPSWFGGREEAPRNEETPAAAVIEPTVKGEPISVVDVVQKLKPAIVSVVSMQSFGAEEAQSVGLGSGIVYRKNGAEGRVVTNHHVIDGASSIEVVLSDGKRLAASLIGSDMLTDLAVLRVDGREVLGVAEFGDSDALQEGEPAIAIGHPFGLGYSPSFTLGIISSLHRIIPISLAMDGQIDWEMELLQTDAAINHGNSGGALVNMSGKVIGINSMKVAQSGVEGLGFAIPSNSAVPIVEELELHGKIVRPYLGVASVDLGSYRFGDDSEETLDLPDGIDKGIIVLETYGPAADAGLRTNDVIVALDEQPIDSTLKLRKYMYEHKQIGDSMRVDYYRGNEKLTATVTLVETPDP